MENQSKDELSYYYCSVSTFKNIIENNSFWMAEPRKQNDSEEISWFFENLLPAVDKEIAKDLRVKYFEKETLTSTPWLFISCFTMKYGDKLSCWRGYGDDGKGVSLGFDLQEIVDSNKSLSKQEILYANKTPQKNIIEKVQRDVKEIRKLENVFDVTKALTEKAIKYKNSAFREENEVRLIYNTLTTGESFNMKFRGISNNLIRYVETNFPKSSLKSIVIGPRCGLDENTIKDFLESRGYNNALDISVSDASYRAL